MSRMTQQNSTTNWVIQDSGGQPQMFKLVQSAGKPVSGIMTSSMAGQSVKIIKATGQEAAQAFSTTGSHPQVIRASKLVTKAVALPAGTALASRGAKMIKLTPEQMQNLRLVSSPQKIHINPTPIASTIVPPSPVNQKNFISPPILDHSGTRKRQEPFDAEFPPESKRSRKTEKVGKGLRHFSMRVCEKVRKKGTTSYNEVADELVGEFTNATLNSSLAEQQYDQKNIRRRVYDALNVLMAMNIISKEKKEIRWIGLPTNSLQECVQLQKEKQKKIESIKEKTKQLQELIMNQIAFKNLAQRNKENEKTQGPPPPNSFIKLPFIVVNTNKRTVIDCSISNDKMEYLFQFNDKFEINDDLEVLKCIGMLMGLDKGECTKENLERLKSMVPKALEEHVIQMATGQDDYLQQILESAGPGPSVCLGMDDPLSTLDEVLDSQLDEENSHQSSSFNPLSPSAPEFTDEEGDSDLSSDELN